MLTPRAEDSAIVAVVVTFNRLPLVQRLLPVLLAEPRLARIIVVDNASSDGTSDWVTALAEPRVAVRVLAENTGGAGGFRAGLDDAIQGGADLVWLMDDDGLPQPGCLETLLAHAGELDFWGPLVVDEAVPDQLVFPIRLPGGTRVVHRLSDVRAAAREGLIRDVVIPFNGVLVTKELVAKIGSVRADYFIWGDDHEYRLRAMAAGARTATVVDAQVAHPSVGALGTPMAFGKMTYNDSPSDLKHYCMARNNLLNLRDYKSPLHAAAFVLKTIWFYTFTRPSPRRLKLSAQAMYAGFRGDFTGHRRFLQ